MSLRVLIVTPVFWPEAFRINDVARHLVEMGHQVEVLAGHPNYPEGRYFAGYSPWNPWREVWEDVSILRFPQIPRGSGAPWRLMLQYASYVLLGGLRILAHGRWDWDAILVFQTSPVTVALPALLAQKLSGGRSVIWVQDLWPDSLAAVGIRLPTWLLNPIRGLSSRIYRSFDQVLGQNEAFLPRLKSLGVPESRLACVPQWADEAIVGVDAAIPPLWPEGKFTLLFAGNLGRAQGLEGVLEAVEILKASDALQWVFMGEGSLAGWLAEMVTRRGLSHRVLLTGRRPAEEMPCHYRRSQALLVSLRPDPALADTIPGKVQACLAAGRPILGAVEGAAADVILKSGAGRVAPPGNPAALAAEAEGLMEASQATREEMGRKGRAYYAQHFSQAACLQRLTAALKRR